ncbi:MAG TPA: AMP-binding protein, partial [Rhizobacter sp.]|nr:AMP-binding protein [Rhizobacter sp.]
MQKPWLKSYPPGVPAEVNVAQYNSLVELLEESYAKFAERDAAICMGARLKFRDVDRMSTSLAAWLQAKGLKPGARVAIMMPNVLQY